MALFAVKFLLWVAVACSMFDLLGTCMQSYRAFAERDLETFHNVNMRAGLYGICLTLALGFLALALK